jgi:hypothetical protein
MTSKQKKRQLMEDLNEFVDTRVMQKRKAAETKKNCYSVCLLMIVGHDKTSSKEEAKNPLISWEIIWNKQNTEKKHVRRYDCKRNWMECD